MISVALVIVLGYVWKASGAALALLCSEIVGVFLMNRQLKAHIAFSSVKHTVRPLIAAISAGLVLYIFKEVNVLVLIFAGIAIYLFVLYIIKGISMSELSVFRKILSDK